MAERSISEIMAEGQKLTLEHAELLRKSITGTLTSEEAARKSVLEGYLLGLMGEAQARGVGIGVGTEYRGEENLDEVDEDPWGAEDEDLMDEGEDAADEVSGFRFY